MIQCTYKMYTYLQDRVAEAESLSGPPKLRDSFLYHWERRLPVINCDFS